MASRGFRLRVQRFDPSTEAGPRFEEYDVPMGEAKTVLDALLYVKRKVDHSLALRFSCRMASCGSCGMKVDGKARLACETPVGGGSGGRITVQPMDNFPIVRDLVVDLEGLFSKHRAVTPRLVRNDATEQDAPKGEYLVTPGELEATLQFTHCIKCGLCSSSCPTASTDRLYLGPQALTQAYRYLADVRDQGGEERLEALDSTHGVWRCHFAGTCSAVCPKGVDPALGIQLLKRYVMAGRPPKRREGAGALFPNPNSELLEG